MKLALFAITLGLGSAAVAQDMQQPAPEPAQAAAQDAMGMGQTVAPGNAAPERDARGIPVVSDPATAPPGFNQPPQPGGTGMPANATPAPMADNGPTPPCSRTVTDNCVQTYERGVARPPR